MKLDRVVTDFAVVGIAFLSLGAATLLGQSTTAQLSGTITDSSRAVIPNAEIRVQSVDTGQARIVSSNELGFYTVAQLPPGAYDIRIQKDGFRPLARSGLTLRVNQAAVVDFELEVGTTTEAVLVMGEAPLLEASNASLGQVVDNRKIVDLPLNGRNSMALLSITTGVTPGAQAQFGGQPVLENIYAQGNFSVNSGLQSQSESLLDGVPNNVFLWNAPAFVPSVEAVQEFKVQTNNFSAEYGHTGGGIVNLSTKSGTNSYRGSLFEFFRSNKLDANNFFNNRSGQPRPPFTYNQFGGAIGGPVRLPGYNGTNRTFFFANYEGFRDQRGRTVLTTVPLPQQRTGDFSATRNAAGQAVTIYDPLTVRPTPGVGSGYSRSPFPNNRIPQDRINPVAANGVRLWGAPNLPGTGAAQINNFVANPKVGSTQDQVNLRGDHYFSTSHRTYGRYSYNRNIPGQTDVYGTEPGARPINPFEFNTALLVWANSAAFDHTWIKGSRTLLNFRYGFTRQWHFRDPATLGIDLTTLGFSSAFNNAVQLRSRPNLNVAGYDVVGEGGNVYFRRGDNVHSFHTSVSHTMDRHNLKAGFEFRTFLFNDARAPQASGAFNFNPAFTQADPLRAAANSGHSMASFLLGHPSGGSVQFFPAVSINQDYYGLFVQDDIRITPKLTINLGLRWDLETPKNERYNRLSSFDSTVVSPLAQPSGLDLRGGLRFLGVDGISRGQWRSDRNNFAPRFGFAYRITDRFVARGGYGIFFHQTVGQGGLVGNGNDGFGSNNNVVTSPDGGITPGARLHDPFPEGLRQPAGAGEGLLSRVGQTLAQWDPVFDTAYSQHFNFGLQFDVPRLFLIDAAYVGSHSVGVPILTPVNQMNPEFLSLGTSLLQQVPNPLFGLIEEGPMRFAQVPRNRLLRPYPHFDNINYFTPIGQGNYNSFQLKLERRFADQIGFLMAYTASKALTDAGGGGIFGFNNPATQNNWNRSLEKALSPIDVSQRMVVSFNWEFPFGRGRALGSNASGILNGLISGWQMNGITTFQTGNPLLVTTQVNQTNALGGTSRPNVAASPNLPGDSRALERWFDTSVFSQPPAFTFGNAPRTLPDTRSPGLQNFDLSLFKNTRLMERMSLQLRFEFFNAFNRANFGSPGTVFGNPQFGVIGSSSAARVSQVAAKILF